MRRADHSHRGGRAVLLVVGVEDEQDVERPGQNRVRLEAGFCDLPHHRQEVGAEVERVVRVDERHPDAEAVRRRRKRRHLGDEPGDLLAPRLRVEDVLGVQVEGRQRRHRGYEHPHRMGVVVEALQEPLADVLVNERVVRDLVAPLLELGLGRELAVEQQVGDLEVCRGLGQLLDRDSPGSGGCPRPRRR